LCNGSANASVTRKDHSALAKARGPATMPTAKVDRSSAGAVCRAAVLIAMAVATQGATPPFAGLRSDLVATQRAYTAAQSRVAAEHGPDIALLFSARLNDDEKALERAEQIPPGITAADWDETLRTPISLDLSAVHQMLDRRYQTISKQPGLREVFVKSSVDGTMQSAALYVPAGPDKPRPLVILLHGHDQSEAQILGPPFFRRLADSTGSIVLAPYARAQYFYAEPGATDVYDALRAARDALPVDPRHVYLVGYSMGGYSLFRIGPRSGAPWTAVMCISGAILNNDVMRTVLDAWRQVPVYVVTGAHDDVVPTKDAEATALALHQNGLPVSFYREPSGTHSIHTLIPSLSAAWHDMHDGIVRGMGLMSDAPNHLPYSAPKSI
jgi:acetyl esterase/lipase